MLKFQLDSLEGVDTALHGFYDKTDSGYTLKIDGLEDTGGLKTALQKERDSNKEAKQRLADLEKLRDEAERKTLETQGQYKELSEKERADKIVAQQKYDELQRKVAEKTRDLMVRDLASSMTSDPVELDIIVKFSSDYVNINGEDVQFAKPIEELKTEMSRFVRSKANDMDDKGNNRGNGQQKTLQRSQFDALDGQGRVEFVKSGGKIL